MMIKSNDINDDDDDDDEEDGEVDDASVFSRDLLGMVKFTPCDRLPPLRSPPARSSLRVAPCVGWRFASSWLGLCF